MSCPRSYILKLSLTSYTALSVSSNASSLLSLVSTDEALKIKWIVWIPGSATVSPVDGTKFDNPN